MLRAVLFDFGDTLIDFEPLDTRAVFRVSARNTYAYLCKQGHPLPPFEQYCRSQFRAVRWRYLWAKLRGRDFNTLDLLRGFLQKTPHPAGQPQHGPSEEAVVHELAWLWYMPLTEHSEPERGAAEALAELRRRGLKLGLISNTFVPGSVLDRHLAMHGLLEFFPVRVYSSEVGYRKPDRRIFEMALERMGAHASESAFVGDLVKTDIVGARRVGMRTVLKQPWSCAGAAHPVADVVIRRLAELPGVLAPMSHADPAPAAQEEYADPDEAGLLEQV
jgi:HAD superfamily hydrolase (TIGR01549 family)